MELFRQTVVTILGITNNLAFVIKLGIQPLTLDTIHCIGK